MLSVVCSEYSKNIFSKYINSALYICNVLEGCNFTDRCRNMSHVCPIILCNIALSKWVYSPTCGSESARSTLYLLIQA